MQCLHPIHLSKGLDINRFPDGLIVPCGKCINCRVQRSREWALRIAQESRYSMSGYFITLTYDDKHCPKCYSLKKFHAVNYIKRIRKESGSKLKYYLCGEYGEQLGRPHYHAIILIYDKERSDEEWKKLLSDKWGQGFVHIGIVSEQSISYCVSYVDKKILDYKKQVIGHRLMPFRLQSQGFGLSYVDDNRSTLKEKKELSVLGKPVGLPRYYKKKLSIDPKDIHKKSLSDEFKKLKAYMKKHHLKEMKRSDWDVLWNDIGRQRALEIEARYRFKYESKKRKF